MGSHWHREDKALSSWLWHAPCEPVEKHVNKRHPHKAHTKQTKVQQRKERERERKRETRYFFSASSCFFSRVSFWLGRARRIGRGRRGKWRRRSRHDEGHVMQSGRPRRDWRGERKCETNLSNVRVADTSFVFLRQVTTQLHFFLFFPFVVIKKWRRGWAMKIVWKWSLTNTKSIFSCCQSHSIISLKTGFIHHHLLTCRTSTRCPPLTCVLFQSSRWPPAFCHLALIPKRRWEERRKKRKREKKHTVTMTVLVCQLASTFSTP